MKMFRARLLIYLALTAAFLVAPLRAQVTTADLTGTVISEGNPLPGVTVTVSAPSLQGTRTTVTGENGTYLFRALPPGPKYTVTFELEGLQKVQKVTSLSLSQTTRVDAELAVSAVAEAIVVTAQAPSVLETSEVTTNFDAKLIEELPVGRRIQDQILLAPGTQGTGPGGGAGTDRQVIINGAQSFDNLYLVNGVVVNDNVRGQPEAVYIEDAVQETTLLTAGISAEYGRFTGGVVNTITKSGGNEFSGSLRDNLTNDDWKGKTPFAAEADHIDTLNEVYEGTLGGRILRDRLWFFAAGRMEERSEGRQLVQTNIPYTYGREDERWEGKLTGAITQNHNVVLAYVERETVENNYSFGVVVDENSLTNRVLPNTLLSAHYNGVLGTNFLLEGLYSQRELTFQGGGSPYTDLIRGTMLRDLQTSGSNKRRMWSPTFRGNDKERDNELFALKGSYYLTTNSLGDHNIVAGIEDFHELRNENNFQSGSEFRLHGNFIYVGDQVYFEAVPGKSFVEWDPVLNLSKTSDFATQSVYINDKWELNPNFSFNIGARYDKNDGTDQAGNQTTDDARVSHRLGATYDVKGNGRHRFNATYGRYVAKVDQGPADSASTAGRPASFYWDYAGPAINGPGTTNYVSTDEVIQQMFAWFESVGGVNNTTFLDSQNIPGASDQFRETLKSPYMDEITLGYGMQFNNGAWIRADYITREWSDFYGINRDTTTGQTVSPSGAKIDIGFVENVNEGLSREYQGLQFQGAFRPIQRLTIGGNYTWSELTGNVEGETSNNATVLVWSNRYPEYTNFDRNRPEGYLDGDVRHRANLWVGYDVPMPFGNLNLSLLERFHTGQAYSAIGTVDPRFRANANPANPNRNTECPTCVPNPNNYYATPPSSVDYYFSDRGEFRLDDITSTDVAANFSFPLRALNLFVQADVINLLDEDGIEDTRFIRKDVITARTASNFANGRTGSASTVAERFNPLTETPVYGKHWDYHKDFGKPTSADAYQQARTYRFSVGVKF